MTRLTRLVETENPGRGARIFSLLIQLLIILSIISYTAETLPDLSAQTRRWLHILEIVVISIFTVEYVLRFIAAPDKKAYVFSFFGIVDLLVILPFYLSLGFDLRALRVLWLLRLLQLFKLARYNESLRRLTRAFELVRMDLAMFGVIALLSLYLSSVGIYFFEHDAQPDKFASIPHSMWWALASLTTVGYGDIYPITLGGRMFTFFVLLVGLGVIAVPTGLISSALVKARDEANEERDARIKAAKTPGERGQFVRMPAAEPLTTAAEPANKPQPIDVANSRPPT